MYKLMHAMRLYPETIRYIYAICVSHRHMAISRSRRSIVKSMVPHDTSPGTDIVFSMMTWYSRCNSRHFGAAS